MTDKSVRDYWIRRYHGQFRRGLSHQALYSNMQRLFRGCISSCSVCIRPSLSICCWLLWETGHWGKRTMGLTHYSYSYLCISPLTKELLLVSSLALPLVVHVSTAKHLKPLTQQIQNSSTGLRDSAGGNLLFPKNIHGFYTSGTTLAKNKEDSTKPPWFSVHCRGKTKCHRQRINMNLYFHVQISVLDTV